MVYSEKMYTMTIFAWGYLSPNSTLFSFFSLQKHPICLRHGKINLQVNQQFTSEPATKWLIDIESSTNWHVQYNTWYTPLYSFCSPGVNQSLKNEWENCEHGLSVLQFYAGSVCISLFCRDESLKKSVSAAAVIPTTLRCIQPSGQCCYVHSTFL